MDIYNYQQQKPIAERGSLGVLLDVYETATLTVYFYSHQTKRKKIHLHLLPDRELLFIKSSIPSGRSDQVHVVVVLPGYESRLDTLFAYHSDQYLLKVFVSLDTFEFSKTCENMLETDYLWVKLVEGSKSLSVHPKSLFSSSITSLQEGLGIKEKPPTA
ncbi:hypothetical protein J6590_057939 [Homalodisca vitripennis]|nr:hypothetical protein J6590_057939 [Homalodisca vitripennis]